jgi:hypothetical protein
MRSFIDRLAAARIGQTTTSTGMGRALPNDATGSRRISTLAQVRASSWTPRSML